MTLDPYDLSLLGSDDDNDSGPGALAVTSNGSGGGGRGGGSSTSTNHAMRPYAKNGGNDADAMRADIARLENELATRIAARAPVSDAVVAINASTSSTSLERSSRIEKYVEVMELTKCLRRQKEFLLNENRKRQRFAEKIQQAMPPSTDSLQFMKNVKYPSDDELQKIAQEAFQRMRTYSTNGKPMTYLGWETKRESKSMYIHSQSTKSFPGEDLTRVFNETWALTHDENKQERLHRRRSKFCILRKLSDSMYLTRNIHQFIGESFPRHSMLLVFQMSIDANNFVIVSTSVTPPTNDAQHLVWTDECFMWHFTRRTDATGGFDVSLCGQYGSTSAVAGNQLPSLESYFFLVDWESLVIRPMFNFSSS